MKNKEAIISIKDRSFILNYKHRNIFSQKTFGYRDLDSLHEISNEIKKIFRKIKPISIKFIPSQKFYLGYLVALIWTDFPKITAMKKGEE